MMHFEVCACLQGFLAEGLQRTSAGLGSVIIDSQPLTVALLASVLFGERLGALGFVGLGLGVVGLCFLEVPVEALQGELLLPIFRSPAAKCGFLALPYIPYCYHMGKECPCLLHFTHHWEVVSARHACSVLGMPLISFLHAIVSKDQGSVGCACALCRCINWVAGEPHKPHTGRLNLGQRGMVDAARSAEHGSGYSHGALGLQIRRPCHGHRVSHAAWGAASSGTVSIQRERCPVGAPTPADGCAASCFAGIWLSPRSCSASALPGASVQPPSKLQAAGY